MGDLKNRTTIADLDDNVLLTEGLAPQTEESFWLFTGKEPAIYCPGTCGRKTEVGMDVSEQMVKKYLR